MTLYQELSRKAHESAEQHMNDVRRFKQFPDEFLGRVMSVPPGKDEKEQYEILRGARFLRLLCEYIEQMEEKI